MLEKLGKLEKPNVKVTKWLSPVSSALKMSKDEIIVYFFRCNYFVLDDYFVILSKRKPISAC